MKKEDEEKIVHLADIPKDSLIEWSDGLIRFHHLDGMYSYCTFEKGKHAKAERNNVIHLSVMTPLIEIADKYYKLAIGRA